MKTVALIAAFVAVLAAGCGGSDDTTGDPNALTVVAEDFTFDPQIYEVTGGLPAVVELRNLGSVEHTWTLLRAGEELTTADGIDPARIIVEVLAEPAQATTATFTAPAAGEYHVICTIPGHLEAGMEAMLRSAG